jgi:hypothetical protein
MSDRSPHPDFPPERPWFRTADDYLAHVAAAVQQWCEPWPPATVDELRAVAAWFPSLAKRWLPTPEIRRRLGVPYLGRPVKPWSGLAQERLLATLVADREFAAAVRAALEVQQ